jgi:hypothetical protein
MNIIKVKTDILNHKVHISFLTDCANCGANDDPDIEFFTMSLADILHWGVPKCRNCGVSLKPMSDYCFAYLSISADGTSV